MFGMKNDLSVELGVFILKFDGKTAFSVVTARVTISQNNELLICTYMRVSLFCYDMLLSCHGMQY